MSAEITKITGIGFASVMNDKPLYCVLFTVIFIDALKKCAVALMLISHFIVDEDWKLSCWGRLTRQAFWQRGEKSHLCQWKQNKMEANVTIKVAKDREKDSSLQFGTKCGARDGREDEEEVMRGPKEKSAWWNDCRIEKIQEGDGCYRNMSL